MAKWHTLLINGDSNLTAEAATEWVRRSEPDAICEELEVLEQDAKKFKATLTAFRSALSALRINQSKDQFNQLLTFRSVIQGKDPQVCRNDTVKQAQNEPLPDDVFLLPTLPQIENGSAVVLLREIVGVKHENVCYRTVDASTSEMFLRVGRLHPTFKYAISQAFGSLYSRIGLPDDYEDRCKSVIEHIHEFNWE